MSSKPEKKVSEVTQHKQSLKNLKDLDSEFYEFLEQNDQKLLNFDLSDSDDDEDEKSDVHTLPIELEIASDESDFEADDKATTKRSSNTVTVSRIRQWEQKLKEDKSVSTIAEVISAFHAALEQIGVTSDKELKTKYKVEGATVFNAVVRLCILDLVPALKVFLKAPPSGNFQPGKSKRWNKVKGLLRSYLMDLITLSENLCSSGVSRPVLRHILHMVPYFAAQPKPRRLLLRHMVNVWSSAEEASRVLALLIIVRLVRGEDTELLAAIAKKMYLAYVSHCKFTSPTTWPLIQFMRRSLVELLLLDENMAYQLAFVFVRQQAILLRNALTVQKKESVQAVYNWQYIHCLHLWSDLLASGHPKPHSLAYPLVQVILGTMKLVPTAKFYPLLLHCCRILNHLVDKTQVFVPVQPFLIQILTTFDFNQRSSKVSFKPMSFNCILRVTKSQLQETGFKDTLLQDTVHVLLENLQSQAHTISFPEVTLPAILQMKAFTKKCRVPRYCQQVKQLLEKIQETITITEKRRQLFTHNLSDTKAIESWEAAYKAQGNALQVLYREVTEQHKLKTYREDARKIHEDKTEKVLPYIRKKMRGTKDTTKDVEEFKGLFPSDESDSEEISFLPQKRKIEETEELTPKKKKTKKRKVLKEKDAPKMESSDDEAKIDMDDLVTNLQLNDLDSSDAGDENSD